MNNLSVYQKFYLAILGFCIFTQIATIPNLYFGDGLYIFGPLAFFQLIYLRYIDLFYVFSIGIGLLVLSVLYNLVNGPAKGVYGNAEFAKLKDLDDLKLNTKSGIFLGKAYGKYIFTNSGENLSSIIMAPSGVGKTTSIIIPSILKSNDSMIIYDLKGEIFESTHETIKTHIDTEVWGFHETVKSSIFNPFCKTVLEKFGDDWEIFVNDISYLLFKPVIQNHNNDFFIARARLLFQTIAKYHIYKNGGSNIVEILTFYKTGRSGLKAIAASTDEGIPESIILDAKSFLYEMEAKTQWGGIMGEFSNILRPFEDKSITDIMNGENEIDPESFRKKTKILYVIVPANRQLAMGNIVGMLFDFFRNRLISKLPEKSDNTITLVLDEFAALGKMEALATFPSISRGYKVNSVFVVQDLEQLNHIYGHQVAKNLINNCFYKICLNQSSFETSKYLSDMIGNQTIERNSLTKNKDPKSRNSVNISQEGLALVSPQDFGCLKQQAIIITSSFRNKPLKLDLIPYFDYPEVF